SSASREITLGIRPSDLRFDPEAPEGAGFDLNVRVSEYIGAQSVLLCDCGSVSFTVEVKSETPIALGEKLRFGCQAEALHLFDKTSGQAVLNNKHP
ncbi:MAG: TOBE domain-containing protein, partial [Litoreibacter sp.]|nr:TOBE domain-containing protein [Litoreibacter sp.]